MTKLKILHFLLTCTVVLTGCEIFAVSDRLKLIVPELSYPLLEADLPNLEALETGNSGNQVSWTVRQLADDGRIRSWTAEGDEAFTIEVPREMPIIITIRPASAGGPKYWQCRPAGFISGRESLCTAVTPSWADGFAAELLLDLAEGGMDVTGLNVTRFAQVVRDRGSSTPWNIDRQKLAADMIKGSLWVYSVRLAASREVHLPLPPGVWYSDYPLDSPLVSQGDGWEGPLVDGHHYFIHRTERHVAEIWIADDEDPLLLLHRTPQP
ncbi:MAG: hypothetical protein B6D68_01465 [spirochete symbiont of Stewartia floridana]|nr:MAG: hypothetical protein B6D68_01465 [spirochete symbiont of Stewartia floridana]